MQKLKRKSGEEDSSSPKKKKEQFNSSNNEIKVKDVINEKTFDKTVKKYSIKRGGKTNFKKDSIRSGGKPNFKKDSTKPDGKFNKDGKKFNKHGNFKGKPNFSKDKQNFNKDKKFSKDDNNGEKPVWSEMKKEKKELRIVRRKAKATAEVFEISHKAKLLSAQIQRKVLKPDHKLNACKELHGILKGQYKSIALTHDLSRVIQVLLKYGPEDIKTQITEELLDIIVQMVQSKYAQHAVKRIIKYGTVFIRHEVLKRFYGHIVTLAAHTISAPVLDYAYSEFASKNEKIHMQQEFYGDIYKNTKDANVKTLNDTYKDSPQMKTAILQSCKANIQRILDKNLHDGELLHSVLYDYIRECSEEERAELITTLSPLIAPLSNSLPGANAATMCVWQGTNKDKKSILKVIKEHAVPLAKHKTGYRLLIAVFDSVDDTVLVKKAVVASLAASLQDIAKDHWGNMTLHWLVKPKDPAAFHPTLIKFLEEGAKSGTSKKDPEVRVSELREAILPLLTKDMIENPEFWLSSKTTMLLSVAVLSIESSKEIRDALAKVICKADWYITDEEKQTLAVEDAGIHMCLKKLATLDKDRSGTLSEAIGEHLSEETLKKWLPTNRGCFFLLKLIESNRSAANKIIKKVKLNANLLKQQSSEGAKLLLLSVQK